MKSLSFDRDFFGFIDEWEHEFIVSVLPNLSLTELSFMPEIRTQHENRLFWNNLRQNITLTSLHIPWLDTSETWEHEWEHDFIAALPDLPLKIIKIGNFQPRVAGWERLCKSVYKNLHLEYLEGVHFESLTCGWKKKSKLPEAERRYVEKLMRIVRLNKAGRRLTIENSFNTALWPIVLERVNRCDFLGSRDCNFEKKKIVNADLIYEFLRGPMINNGIVNP
jgi:hypothetical protein